MRTLCVNDKGDDGLATVLEVPIPEESYKHKSWNDVMSWIRPQNDKESPGSGSGGEVQYRGTEIQFVLGVIGAPLAALPIRSDAKVVNTDLKGLPMEVSMAKYIVQQYIAAVGGEHALNSIESMYAMGKVTMMGSEFVPERDSHLSGNIKAVKMKNAKRGPVEMGGFVLWQKRPDLWSLELAVSGFKINAGSDGKVGWRQTPWQPSHECRGPPRPLRRSLQGLDPRSTANLFSKATCIGEKTINNEDCFMLKVEAETSMLKARSNPRTEIIRHSTWSYFSQRTGLLVQLQDTQLLRIVTPDGNDVIWETTIESMILDYRTINGVNIAHTGRTTVSLFRFGESSLDGNSRTRMEEVWNIEEVDFNIKGLSNDCFLPPADLKVENELCGGIAKNEVRTKGSSLYKILSSSSRIGAPRSSSKVVSIEEEKLEVIAEADE